MAVPCGCFYYPTAPDERGWKVERQLPQVKLQSYTTILSTASRTTLKQTYSNPSAVESIEECVYRFPLYDGVSVVSFTCRIGSRTLDGVVKEKTKARKTYHDAVARGETAGLFEQLSGASDVFRTRLGNIPAGESVLVEIAYVGELKQDAETDGIRFTLPTMIAPRYGTALASNVLQRATSVQEEGGIEIKVDVSMTEGSSIKSIQSLTHPIAVTMGSLSASTDSDAALRQASVTLSLGTTELDKDFVLIIVVKDIGTPKALLETHPTIPNQRALMVTLVPNFSLPPARPEIVFVADRSYSMHSDIPTLISALKIFLKSLPVGVMFNICSFGFDCSFLWAKSRAYSRDSLAEAISHVRLFKADFGGTETLRALSAAIKNRHRDMACELMLLTDGQIDNQTEVFSYLNQEVRASDAGLRVFTLGIGDGISHALVEGIARAGNGFAQIAGSGEKLDKKVVRMLKGALSPHISGCELEVEYESPETDDESFEMVERVSESLKISVTEDFAEIKLESGQKPIPFFDEKIGTDTAEEVPPSAGNDEADPYAHLPTISIPKLLQSPSAVPPLFSFSRTAVYIILSLETIQESPKSVILRGKSSHGPLELKIPVETVSHHGGMIHQLATRKGIQELEESRGWIFDARDETGTLVQEKFPSRFVEIVEREAVRLGTTFQVGGKWCSFVAVSKNCKNTMDEEWEIGSSDFACTFNPTAKFGGHTLNPNGGSDGDSDEEMGTGLFEQSEEEYLIGMGMFGPSDEEEEAEEAEEVGKGQGFSGFMTTGGLFTSNQIAGAIDCSRGETTTAETTAGSSRGGPTSLFGRGPATSIPLPEGCENSSRNDVTLNSIIEMQSFDGHWNINEGLRKAMGIDEDIVDEKQPTTIWSTVLVVVFLETKMEEDKDVWVLVVEKARAWLKDQNQALESWEKDAQKLFLSPGWKPA